MKKSERELEGNCKAKWETGKDLIVLMSLTILFIHLMSCQHIILYQIEIVHSLAYAHTWHASLFIYLIMSIIEL